MRISTIGWLIFLTAAIVAAGEFVLATVLSGAVLAEGPVYQEGAASPEIVAVVSEQDKPVTAIFTVTGVRRGFARNSSDNTIETKLNFGDGFTPQKRIFRPRPRTNTARPNYFNTYYPVAINDRPVGNWRLSLDVRPGGNIELDSIYLQLKTGTRPVNMMLIIIALAIAAFGFVLGLFGRRL